MKNKILILTASLGLALAWTPVPSEAITIIIAENPGGAFEGTSTGINPANGQETSEFNLQMAYLNLFGFPSPNELPSHVNWGETPTQLAFGFRAEGKNVSVNTFQELDIDIVGNYWTLDSKLTFNPSTAVIVDPNDHIIFEGTLQHFGKLSTNDFPHEGDDMKGGLMPFSVDVSAGDKQDAAFGQLAYGSGFAIADHPSVNHIDALLGVLQARVVSPSIFFDEIEGAYTGIMVAFHLDDQGPPPVVPEPASVWLLSTGLAGLVAARRCKRSVP